MLVCGHKYGDMLTISPRSTRSAQRSFWKLIRGVRCVIGRPSGKIFTAETAEGAEMIGVNDHPEQSLRSPRALR